MTGRAGEDGSSRFSRMALEVLRFPFLLYGRLERFEGAQVPALAGGRVFLARI